MIIPDIPFNNRTNERSNIEVIDIEKLSKRSNLLDHDPERPHRVGFYLLIFIENGHGAHMIDFNSYPFSDNSFIFVNARQVQSFDFSSCPTGKVLLFNQSFLEEALNNVRLSIYSPIYLLGSLLPILAPSKSVQRSAKNLLHELAQEQCDKADGNIMLHLFASLILILQRVRPFTFQGSLNKKQINVFFSFLDYLKENFSKSRDASFYAIWIGVTYKTLNHVCKQATGKTAKQLIDEYTILEIKRRLTADGVNAQSLSFSFGFEDPNNFVKYFKKHTLLTPTQFQRTTKS